MADEMFLVLTAEEHPIAWAEALFAVVADTLDLIDEELGLGR